MQQAVKDFRLQRKATFTVLLVARGHGIRVYMYNTK